MPNFLLIVFDDGRVSLLLIISVVDEIYDLGLTFEFHCQVRMSIELVDQAH